MDAMRLLMSEQRGRFLKLNHFWLAEGECLLYVAAKRGYNDVVRFLMEVERDGGRPASLSFGLSKRIVFDCALEGGNVDVCRLLLESKDPPKSGAPCLISAAKRGHTGVCRLLLGLPEGAPRADSEGSAALAGAVRGSKVEVCKLLLEWPSHSARADASLGRHPHSILGMAACNGDAEICRLLLGSRYPPTQEQRAESLEFARERWFHAVAEMLTE
jgi:ankyrin repeat protein